jgi:CheY-like chemotaxis protein
MYQERILICMPAPIIGIGLHSQFEQWGFKQIEYVMNVESAIESVSRQAPSLLIMDADWPDTENSYTLIQLLRREGKNIPVIFMSKIDGQTIEWKEQLQWLSPYQWLSKPCYTEDLWQAIESLLPNFDSSSQQG